MSETEFKKEVLEYLNSLPRTKAIKLRGSIYMERGTPDILCVHKGVPIFLELKVGKNVASKMQERQIKEWQSSGARAMVIRNMNQLEQLITGLNSSLPEMSK